MNNHILTSLSIITSFHNKNKSVLDAFLPIVEYGIATLESNKQTGHYDVDTLKDEIFNNTGVKINRISLISLLKRFEKNKEIALMDNNNYYRIENKTNQAQYLEAINKHNRSIQNLILKYKEFNDDKRKEDEIIEWIYTFVTEYSKYILVQKGDVRFSDMNFMQYKPLVDFLIKVNESDNEAIQTFINIYYGFSLCEILNNNQLEIQQLKINDITIYLDSNFLLRLMDLQEEHACEETKELYDILHKHNARLRIFKETIEEIKQVISYYYNYYKTNNQIYNSLLDTPEYISGVLGAFYRRKLTFFQIEDIIDEVEDQIEQFGISVDALSRYKTNVSEDELNALYTAKYGETSKEEQSNYRSKKCKNYLAIREVIQYRRSSEKAVASCLGKSKFVFLTCDKKLCQYSRSKDTTNKYPLIVSQELLANDLMLFDPQNFSSIAIRLMASVYTESQYLDVHILDDLSKTIVAVSKENPENADYIINATRNSMNFEKINEIFKDNIADNKLQLIELSQKSKEKEAREEADRKNLLADNQAQQNTIEEQRKDISKLQSELNQSKLRTLEAEEMRKQDATSYFVADMNNYIKRKNVTWAILTVLFTLVLVATGTLTLFWDVLVCWAKIVLSVTQYLLSVTSILTRIFNLKMKWFRRCIIKKVTQLLRKYNITMEDVTNYNENKLNLNISKLLLQEGLVDKTI